MTFDNELDEVLTICKTIAAAHPDVAPDVDRLLKLVIKKSRTEA